MPHKTIVQFVRLPGAEDIELPAYASPGSSGLDLRAAVSEPLTLQPGQRVAVPTGLVVLLPPDTEGQIRSRSGLGLRYGIVVAHGVGSLDEDFVGQTHVLLLNISDTPYTISRGDRIAQLIVAPVLRVDVREGFDIPKTGRGEGGFGSTGKS